MYSYIFIHLYLVLAEVHLFMFWTVMVVPPLAVLSSSEVLPKFPFALSTPVGVGT